MPTHCVTIKNSRTLIVGLTMAIFFWGAPVINYSAYAQDLDCSIFHDSEGLPNVSTQECQSNNIEAAHRRAWANIDAAQRRASEAERRYQRTYQMMQWYLNRYLNP